VIIFQKDVEYRKFNVTTCVLLAKIKRRQVKTQSKGQATDYVSQIT